MITFESKLNLFHRCLEIWSMWLSLHDIIVYTIIEYTFQAEREQKKWNKEK